MPASNPMIGLPVMFVKTTALNAPAVIMPSKPMFTTPARSEITPPSAA